MFVRQLDCVTIPNKSGLVISLHKQSRKYFLNTSNDIQRYIRGLIHYVTRQEGETLAFLEFRLMAKSTALSDWEFHYSIDPSAPVPQEILHKCSYVYSNVGNDAVISKKNDRAIFKVEHKNTIFPVYVVDRCCAKKKVVMRKAVSQLKRYANAGERAWYAKYVLKNASMFDRALDAYECSMDNLGRYSLHDVSYEPVAFDEKSFVTHTAAAAHLNLQALMSWKQSQQQLQ